MTCYHCLANGKFYPEECNQLEKRGMKEQCGFANDYSYKKKSAPQIYRMKRIEKAQRPLDLCAGCKDPPFGKECQLYEMCLQKWKDDHEEMQQMWDDPQ